MAQQVLGWGEFAVYVDDLVRASDVRQALEGAAREAEPVAAEPLAVRIASLQSLHGQRETVMPAILCFEPTERDEALALFSENRVFDVVPRTALAAQLPLALRRVARERHRVEPLHAVLRLLEDVNAIEQASVGVDYLNVMVARVADALGFDYVFVGEINDANTSVTTCSLWTPSGMGENFAYDLEGTPCLEVFAGRRVCTHAMGVADEFPDDLLLREMGIEAYVGAPLIRPDGQGLGLFVALDSKPRRDAARFEPVFEFFASRASAELDRVRVERHLRAANEALERRVAERTEELEVTQLRVIELAHRAGMADAAAVVLHNVGNLLNSVTVGAARIRETASALPLDALAQACALLQKHEGDLASFLSDDSKGMRVPSLLAEIEAVLREDAADLLEDAQTVQFQARQIADVVRSQQEQAEHDRLTEDGDAVQYVKTCTRLFEQQMQFGHIDVDVRAAALPPVRVQRVKFFQVLANLLRNAADALVESDAPSRSIRISFVEERQFVAIALTDSGPGVPSEFRDRLFEFGFSTKSSGAGVGLHSSANFMTEMGGSLRLAPHVEGEGATFVLRVPRADASTEPLL